MEIWVDVIDYEGLYRVSSWGRIKCLSKIVNMPNGGVRFYPEAIMKVRNNGFGYLIITLFKNTVKKNHRVHRLVWESFNGKTVLEIDHIIEGNKYDNRLCNLQAVTPRQNSSKYTSTLNKYSKHTGVVWLKKINKWAARIHIDGKQKHLGCFVSEIDASNAYQNALKILLTNQTQ